MSDVAATSGGVQLPPGVTYAGKRETSRTGANGLVEQGLAYSLRMSDGTTTTVFVPYSQIDNPDAVAAAFTQRITALQAIDNLQSGF